MRNQNSYAITPERHTLKGLQHGFTWDDALELLLAEYDRRPFSKLLLVSLSDIRRRKINLRLVHGREEIVEIIRGYAAIHRSAEKFEVFFGEDGERSLFNQTLVLFAAVLFLRSGQRFSDIDHLLDM